MEIKTEIKKAKVFLFKHWYISVIGVFVILILLFAPREPHANPCECVDILNTPTQKVGIGMPTPIKTLSDEDFKLYKQCYDEHAGWAGAVLACKEWSNK